MNRTGPLVTASLLALVGIAGCAPARGRRVPPPPPSPLVKAVIRTARSYLAEEDGNRPTPEDCSDFVGKVFAENGIVLPRSSSGMSRYGLIVRSSRELRMGDLVFFSGSGGGRSIGHVGIYVNNGIFIHQANPGEGVRMESLYSDYYRRHYLSGRRLFD